MEMDVTEMDDDELERIRAQHESYSAGLRLEQLRRQFLANRSALVERLKTYGDAPVPDWEQTEVQKMSSDVISALHIYAQRREFLASREEASV